MVSTYQVSAHRLSTTATEFVILTEVWQWRQCRDNLSVILLSWFIPMRCVYSESGMILLLLITCMCCLYFCWTLCKQVWFKWYMLYKYVIEMRFSIFTASNYTWMVVYVQIFERMLYHYILSLKLTQSLKWPILLHCLRHLMDKLLFILSCFLMIISVELNNSYVRCVTTKGSKT